MRFELPRAQWRSLTLDPFCGWLQGRKASVALSRPACIRVLHFLALQTRGYYTH